MKAEAVAIAQPLAGPLVPPSANQAFHVGLPEHLQPRLGDAAPPRHTRMHPSGRQAYALDELDSTVTAYRLDPEDRFLYAANEHDDTIIRHRRDPATGRLHSPALAARTGSPTTRP